jgi:hypothetical protein
MKAVTLYKLEQAALGEKPDPIRSLKNIATCYEYEGLQADGNFIQFFMRGMYDASVYSVYALRADNACEITFSLEEVTPRDCLYAEARSVRLTDESIKSFIGLLNQPVEAFDRPREGEVRFDCDRQVFEYAFEVPEGRWSTESLCGILDALLKEIEALLPHIVAYSGGGRIASVEDVFLSLSCDCNRSRAN